MALFYEEGDQRAPFRGRPVPYHEQDAVRHWSVHFSNSLMLTFLISRTSGAERAGYLREMTVCERRMLHWRRLACWDAARAAVVAERIRADWREQR